MQTFFKTFRSCLLLLAVGGIGIGQVQAAQASKNGMPEASKNGKLEAKINGKSEADMPKMSQFCWTELATNNVNSAKDFYSKVFGWKFTDKPVGDMTYTMVSVDGKDFAGIWTIPKDQEKQIPPHWLSYICVENLEQSLEKATQNGATVIKPITQAGEYGRLAIIQDPTGAQVALWQMLKPKS